MPVADPALIARANQVLKTGNYAQKLAFLKEVPICPPSNYAHGGAHRIAATEESPFGAGDTRTKKYLSKKKLGRTEDRIAFIKFKAREAASGEPGSLTFDLKYSSDLPNDADRTDYIPIWFLPWESGFMWKITLESAATTPTITVGAATTTAIPNPELFFTAAINGCSVFARGNTTTPRIYHGGAEQNEIAEIRNQLGNALWNQLGGNAEGMWLNVFQGLGVQQGALALRHAPPKAADVSVGEINKNQYVKETMGGQTVLSPLSMRPGLPTADADQPSTLLGVTLENYLLNNGAYRNIRVEEVSPWGCVFGLRNGNNWEFYLQTNATVKYFTIRRTGFFKKKTKYDGQPDAAGKPTQWAKAQSVNFGTRQFFPGAHPHVMVPLNSFRFF